MQKLLASYLFQYKNCPLPGLGHLTVKKSEALIVSGEKKIIAPKEEIIFSADEIKTGDLESFIAAQKSVTKEEAAYQLNRYCAEIKNIQPGEKMIITDAGEFYIDAGKYLAFLPVNIPSAFAPEIFAERVIHPDKAHPILVGDTETTNALMTEYYAGETPKAKSKWWIFAVIFLIIGAGIIIYYLNDENRNSTFGILHKYGTVPSPVTYRELP